MDITKFVKNYECSVFNLILFKNKYFKNMYYDAKGAFRIDRYLALL